MKSVLSIIIVLGSLFFMNCSGEGNAETTTLKKEAGTPVKISVLVDGQFEEYLNLTGVIKANSQVKIVAEEAGVLVKLLHDKGSYVKKGVALAMIENKKQVVQKFFRLDNYGPVINEHPVTNQGPVANQGPVTNENPALSILLSILLSERLFDSPQFVVHNG